ncbi:anhydro-N-acetylmuramic acid kinase [Agrococcus casei]|uniref:anhydro-N-acetylmuramic acid kinase n=1 Tax=Agrococcus casei TaxID=343512 RepID=UPI003F919422
MSEQGTRVLGLISGTSHDGIDAAVVDFEQRGSQLHATVVAADSQQYEPELRQAIIALLPPNQTTIDAVTMADTRIGQAFALVAADMQRRFDGIDLVVSHGQTVFHWVEGQTARGTLQLGQPAWIAEATGLTVVSDIRARDIAAGGQGAPLASTIDALVGGSRPGVTGLLNLGGIANVTVVGEQVRAWDTGPANALVDAVVLDRGLHASGYDDGGAIAASGTVDQVLLQRMFAHEYFGLAAPKSTGKEVFNLDFVEGALDGLSVSDADLVATLTELSAQTVADAVRGEGLAELFASGGGVHNAAFMARLEQLLPDVRIASSSELGLEPDSKEAVLMALLGWLTAHGHAGSVASATGAARASVLGSITPGVHPLSLSAGPAPTSLVIQGAADA